MPEVPESDRYEVLAKYAFGALANGPQSLHLSRKQPPDGLPGSEDQNLDTEFIRNVYAKEILWRQKGYRYRYLLSQREIQQLTAEERALFGRQMSFFYANSELFSRLRQMTNSTFLWVCVVIAISPVFYFISKILGEGAVSEFQYNLYRSMALQTPSYFAAFVSLGVMIRALILLRSPAKPYGMKFRDIVKLILLGPLAPDIHDYQRPST